MPVSPNEAIETESDVVDHTGTCIRISLSRRRIFSPFCISNASNESPTPIRYMGRIHHLPKSLIRTFFCVSTFAPCARHVRWSNILRHSKNRNFEYSPFPPNIRAMAVLWIWRPQDVRSTSERKEGSHHFSRNQRCRTWRVEGESDAG